ncbi:Ku protein [Acidisoma sp. L85]|uniref:non-homologous end joining protein Ku n=1 Tax=Acidisoma sp. L85 TaxID=1641850 RepID=UPI00131A6CA3|nr:Ku protein [Acidisoma sp. L85]
MASRPIWRGHLRLALVSCPVALYNARHDRAAIKFNMINPDTGNRIKMVTQDSGTGEPLERGKTVKGYEFDKNRYLILSDEDFESVKVESSSIMSVEKFVDSGSIDPVYFDASYFLAPDGKAGEDVYAVLREAIAKTGKTALTRVVISQRERTIALRPMGVGLMAHTLYEDRDLNSADDVFEKAVQIKTDPEMVDLAMQLIQRQSGQYDPADLEDRYETRLRALIDAKLAGGGLVTEPERPIERGNVIDLVAALKRSLAQAQTAGEPPKPVKAPKAPDRRQTGLKLPIAGGKGKVAAVQAEPTAQPAPGRARRKA